jgi:hypothetical protein
MNDYAQHSNMQGSKTQKKVSDLKCPHCGSPEQQLTIGNSFAVAFECGYVQIDDVNSSLNGFTEVVPHTRLVEASHAH